MGFEPASAAAAKQQLAQAEEQLNLWLGRRHEADLEIVRWQRVVDSARETIELIESPTAAMKKQGQPRPMAIVETNRSKRRVRWTNEWPVILRELAAKNVHPTRREMETEMRARHGVSQQTAYAALNSAINSGAVVWHLDRIYIPGTEPPRAAAAK